MSYGWQQPGRPLQFKMPSLTPRSCPHILVGIAQTQAYRHAIGHIWKCSCGQEFVVALVKGVPRLTKVKVAA